MSKFRKFVTLFDYYLMLAIVISYIWLFPLFIIDYFSSIPTSIFQLIFQTPFSILFLIGVPILTILKIVKLFFFRKDKIRVKNKKLWGALYGFLIIIFLPFIFSPVSVIMNPEYSYKDGQWQCWTLKNGNYDCSFGDFILNTYFGMLFLDVMLYMVLFPIGIILASIGYLMGRRIEKKKN